MRRTSRIDYLNDSPSSVLCSICLPLIVVNIVLAFTTTLTNELYSRFVGQSVFSIMGYLSAVTTSFGSIVTSVMSAAWIKTAHSYGYPNKSIAERQMFHGLAAIAIVEIACALPLLLLADPILQLLNIPIEIYGAAKRYYLIYILFYLPVPLAALFLTIVNGTSSSSRLFWINIIVVGTNALSAVLLLAVFKAGLVGVALQPMMGALIQIGFYIVYFRRNGFHFSLRRAAARLDWRQVFSIIRYGLLIALQTLLCTLGYLLVTYQANRFLTLEYISVLNVSLPLAGIMSAVSSAGIAFLPPNYAEGRCDRLRRFFAISTICCLLYGCLCFLLYALLGGWYYGRLFQNPQIIAFGTEYWFWFGMGQIFLSIIFPIRTFFDSVGMSKISLLSGIGELLGNLICAIILIPCFGNIGRSLSYPLGYLISSIFLSIAYACFRRKIYANAGKMSNG